MENIWKYDVKLKVKTNVSISSVRGDRHASAEHRGRDFLV